MSKRVTLSNAEISIINMVLDSILKDGGDYALSGIIGKNTVQDLKARLNTEAPDASVGTCVRANVEARSKLAKKEQPTSRSQPHD